MGSHVLDVTVDVLRESTSLGQIPIVEGSVSATYSTQGGRDASLVVSRHVIEQGLLNPMSDEVYIRSIVPGVIEVPLFTGRVDAHNLLSDGSVEVLLLSRGAEAIRAAFEVPWAAQDYNQARWEIRRILQSINSAWAVNIDRANDKTIGRGLAWEDDPGQALDQLARGASLIWQPDRTGGFEVFTNPYLLGPSAIGTDYLTFTDGVDGTVVDVQEAQSREGIFNSVTVVAEKYGNQAAIRVTVRDVGATSPTRWGGPFGKQNLVLKSQIPIDIPQATALARRVLQQSLSLSRTWSITMPNMPLLSPGDCFALFYQGEVTVQVAESISYTVNAQDPTEITSRELREVTAEILAS